MKKTKRLYMRVDKDTKDKIEKMAKQENRSMSNWIESVILEKLEGENKMKKITQKQVMKALQNFTSLEQDYDGTPKYYLHLDENFKPVPGLSEAEYTFITEVGYTHDELENTDLVELEVESNQKFMEAVEELTEKANSLALGAYTFVK